MAAYRRTWRWGIGRVQAMSPLGRAPASPVGACAAVQPATRAPAKTHDSGVSCAPPGPRSALQPATDARRSRQRATAPLVTDGAVLEQGAAMIRLDSVSKQHGRQILFLEASMSVF